MCTIGNTGTDTRIATTTGSATLRKRSASWGGRSVEETTPQEKASRLLESLALSDEKIPFLASSTEWQDQVKVIKARNPHLGELLTEIEKEVIISKKDVTLYVEIVKKLSDTLLKSALYTRNQCASLRKYQIDALRAMFNHLCYDEMKKVEERDKEEMLNILIEVMEKDFLTPVNTIIEYLKKLNLSMTADAYAKASLTRLKENTYDKIDAQRMKNKLNAILQTIKEKQYTPDEEASIYNAINHIMHYHEQPIYDLESLLIVLVVIEKYTREEQHIILVAMRRIMLYHTDSIDNLEH